MCFKGTSQRFLLALLCCVPLLAQFQTGEVRVSVMDATGLPLPSTVTLVSESSRTRREYKTNNSGQFTFQHVPFGMYHLTVSHPGFLPYSGVLEIRSAIPHEQKIQLNIQTASTE